MPVIPSLLSRIEAFLIQSGMSALIFGEDAVNDPRFVYDLRKGRKPGRRVRARVEAFMADWRADNGVPALDDHWEPLVDRLATDALCFAQGQHSRAMTMLQLVIERIQPLAKAAMP